MNQSTKITVGLALLLAGGCCLVIPVGFFALRWKHTPVAVQPQIIAEAPPAPAEPPPEHLFQPPPVDAVPPVGRPERPLLGWHMSYTLGGFKGEAGEIVRLRQELAAVPGVDKATIRTEKNVVHFFYTEKNLLPVNEVFTRLGYRVEATKSAPLR
jgi:hypothetical protein